MQALMSRFSIATKVLLPTIMLEYLVFFLAILVTNQIILSPHAQTASEAGLMVDTLKLTLVIVLFRAILGYYPMIFAILFTLGPARAYWLRKYKWLTFLLSLLGQLLVLWFYWGGSQLLRRISKAEVQAFEVRILIPLGIAILIGICHFLLTKEPGVVHRSNG